MSSEKIFLEAIYGLAVMAIGICGLLLDDLKKGNSNKDNIFKTTSAIGIIFWTMVIPYSPIYSQIWAFIIAAVAISTGYGAKKITEKYGTKGYVVPRFLLGFIISGFIFICYQSRWNPMPLTSTIIGLLFTPITSLTPNFIMALLNILFYSIVLAVGLNMELRLIFDRTINIIVIILIIAIVSGAINLYYYYKYFHFESDTISNPANEGENQHIANNKNSNYSAVSSQEV